MTNRLLNEIRYYKENKAFYSCEERKLIKLGLREKIAKMENSMISIIDHFNNE